MKKIAILTALLLPVAASATLAPIEVIEAEAREDHVRLAAAPVLPFVGSDEATVCVMSVDPLPAVVALAGPGDAQESLVLCFAN